jgi:L-aminopeptidase/D-esterase-like protein
MPLRPHVPADAPAHQFPFAGVRIGIAEYEDGPTGVTLFHFPERAYAVVDIRGGSPGTGFTDALRMSFGKFVSGIAFCGGSAYGFEAAAGISTALLASGVASNQWGNIAVVPSAVVFDFKGRENNIYPDVALGRAALDGARPGWFLCGKHGAGRFVHVGSYFGESRMEQAGQGAAFCERGATKIAVFTVVNSRGVIVDRKGRTVLGNWDTETARRAAISESIQLGRSTSVGATSSSALSENTTLTLLLTNRCMDRDELTRLAITTHSSMARAIQPFHTERDGDTLFAVTTGEISEQEPDSSDLAVLASELAWDAALNCVPQHRAETDSGGGRA